MGKKGKKKKNIEKKTSENELRKEKEKEKDIERNMLGDKRIFLDFSSNKKIPASTAKLRKNKPLVRATEN